MIREIRTKVGRVPEGAMIRKTKGSKVYRVADRIVFYGGFSNKKVMNAPENERFLIPCADMEDPSHNPTVNSINALFKGCNIIWLATEAEYNQLRINVPLTLAEVRRLLELVRFHGNDTNLQLQLQEVLRNETQDTDPDPCPHCGRLSGHHERC